MKVLDPGHKYELASYDGDIVIIVDFMKRMGDNYPFNTSTQAGTNCQEVIRMLHDRVVYLNKQHEHLNNLAILNKLEEILWLFEDRAALKHNINQFDYRPDDIMNAPTCEVCGHIICGGH